MATASDKVKVEDYAATSAVAWCPGCGNFGILRAIPGKIFPAALDQVFTAAAPAGEQGEDAAADLVQIEVPAAAADDDVLLRGLRVGQHIPAAVEEGSGEKTHLGDFEPAEFPDDQLLFPPARGQALSFQLAALRFFKGPAQIILLLEAGLPPAARCRPGARRWPLEALRDVALQLVVAQGAVAGRVDRPARGRARSGRSSAGRSRRCFSGGCRRRPTGRSRRSPPRGSAPAPWGLCADAAASRSSLSKTRTARPAKTRRAHSASSSWISSWLKAGRSISIEEVLRADGERKGGNAEAADQDLRKQVLGGMLLHVVVAASEIEPQATSPSPGSWPSTWTMSSPSVLQGQQGQAVDRALVGGLAAALGTRSCGRSGPEPPARYSCP